MIKYARATKEFYMMEKEQLFAAMERLGEKQSEDEVVLDHILRRFVNVGYPSVVSLVGDILIEADGVANKIEMRDQDGSKVVFSFNVWNNGTINRIVCSASMEAAEKIIDDMGGHSSPLFDFQRGREGAFCLIEFSPRLVGVKFAKAMADYNAIFAIKGIAAADVAKKQAQALKAEEQRKNKDIVKILQGKVTAVESYGKDGVDFYFPEDFGLEAYNLLKEAGINIDYMGLARRRGGMMYVISCSYSSSFGETGHRLSKGEAALFVLQRDLANAVRNSRNYGGDERGHIGTRGGVTPQPVRKSQSVPGNPHIDFENLARWGK